MSTETAQGKENLGIRVPIAPTIVVATFTMLNKGPHGEENYVDVRKRNTAVWLTTPGHEGNPHMVIGADGLPSPIGVLWSPDGPQFVRWTGERYYQVGCERRDEVTVANAPAGEVPFVLAKHYPGLVECYTVFQVQPEGPTHTVDPFSPYIGRHQLVSGMKARGLRDSMATSFLGIRITDGSNLPFGRELRSNRP